MSEKATKSAKKAMRYLLLYWCRVGAGRKKKVRIDSSSPEPDVAEPADASPSIAPAETGPGEPSQNLLVDVIDNLSWDVF